MILQIYLLVNLRLKKRHFSSKQYFKNEIFTNNIIHINELNVRSGKSTN